jgi:transketolase
VASLEERAINTIRFLAVDAVQKANSGHPGLPMGAAPMAYVLWTKFLKHHPRNPAWADRDRFVLSAGHGSMLIYALLHLTGYDVTLDDLKSFRQWGSITPGHPEYGETPGIETTTGPLGQGSANAVGMAMAEAFLAAKYNRPGHTIIDHFTYALVSDGDLMEGISAEAGSLAGHLKLGKLIYLYDDNLVSLAADTNVTFTEDVGKRYEAYGWHVLRVRDGNQTSALEAAIKTACETTDQPSLIMVRTVLGYGSPNKAGTHEAHGSPLGPDEVRATKENLGWPLEPDFYIEDEALNFWRGAVDRGEKAVADWDARWKAYQVEFPELAAELDAALKGQLPSDWDSAIPVFEPDEKGDATRNSSGKVLNAIASKVATFMGGDADLAPSTKTQIKGEKFFGNDGYDQRNIAYGVREHAMGGITNGMAAHGGLIKPYTATFFTFSDYMRPSIRLAALMGLENIFVFTHDSVGLGEDGPTHQPVEHLAAMRAIPNLVVFRPADANETAAAWKAAMLHKGGPVALIFSRQNTPTFDPDGIEEGVIRGAYILRESDADPQAILMGTGTEVAIALGAQELLRAEGIAARVVSMPSFELFRAQDAAYQQKVLPPDVTVRVAIEAGNQQSWHEFLGANGRFVGVVDRFGASAPVERIYEELGLTPEAVAEAVIASMNS